MSRDPKTGYFLPGNKFASRESKVLRKEDRKLIYGMIRKFCFMPLKQMQTFAVDTSKLTTLEAIVIKTLAKGLEKGDLNVLKYILNLFGVVEVKALALQEIDKLSKDDDEEIRDLNIPKDEKLKMIELYKQIVEKDE